jgi:hypothetical protein
MKRMYLLITFSIILSCLFSQIETARPDTAGIAGIRDSTALSQALKTDVGLCFFKAADSPQTRFIGIRFPLSGNGFYRQTTGLNLTLASSLLRLIKALPQFPVTKNGVSMGLLIDAANNLNGIGVGSLVAEYEKVNGIAGGGWMMSSRVNGISFGILNGEEGGVVNGLQVGGLCASEKVNGAQIGIAGLGKALNGLCIGAYNSYDGVKGLQIGIYNNAKVLKGVQIGLLNVRIRSDGIRKSILPFINVGF